MFSVFVDILLFSSTLTVHAHCRTAGEATLILEVVLLVPTVVVSERCKHVKTAGNVDPTSEKNVVPW